MADDASSVPDRDPDAIRSRWLGEARRTGHSDTLGSKRHSPRFAWRAELDVRIEHPDGQVEEFIATARDISETGLMMFCRQQLERFSRAEVSRAGESEAVPVTVRHSTQTFGGYLIGVDFLE